MKAIRLGTSFNQPKAEGNRKTRRAAKSGKSKRKQPLTRTLSNPRATTVSN